MRPSLARIPALLLLTLLLWMSVAPPAQADDDETPESWKITRYDMTADAKRDGAIGVTVDFDFDFAQDEGHGPFVTVPVRQRVIDDPNHWRSFEVTDIAAASSSGASAKVDTETESGVLAIRIGDEKEEVTGVQSYQVSYTISGIVNPGVSSTAPDGTAQSLDEIYWNVISSWQVPLNDVSVTLTGPVAANRVACFTGSKPLVPCQPAPEPGKSVRYAADAIAPKESLQIVAGYPEGTFVGAEPVLTKRYHPGNVIPVTPLSGTLGGAVLLGGIAGLVVAARRVGRDRQYVSAAYGYTPGGADGDASAPTMAATRQPVAVQFSPPKAARPGELGVLTDERADNEDITATIVDLAVRGFLRIEQIPDSDLSKKAQKTKPDDPQRYRLAKLVQKGDLQAYERKLYNKLFSDGDSPTLKELGTEGTLGKAMTKSKESLEQRVAKDLNWFRFNPAVARAVWLGIGIGIAVLGVVLALALGFSIGLGAVGIAVFLVGLATMLSSSVAASRTPEGVAMLQQALGFKLYLSTAEAEQLRFEEGEDLFSRYLPYAIAWGCADRWAKVFEELAAQGMALPEPTWFAGAQPFLWASGTSSMLEGISGFASATAAQMTAATSGSSGGSGFAGGVGVGGGGGGGW